MQIHPVRIQIVHIDELAAFSLGNLMTIDIVCGVITDARTMGSSI